MNKLLDYFISRTVPQINFDFLINLQEISNIRSKIKRDDSLYLSSKSNVIKYLEMFKIFENKPELYNSFFKISKVLPIDSANGRIFLMSLKDNLLNSGCNESSEILVKIPLNVDESDSICYEYYIGLALNSLRINHHTNHFALVYGKVLCGFDNRIDPNVDVDLSNIKICDSTKDLKIHLVYEYIRNTTTKSVHTFKEYMKLLGSNNYSKNKKRKIEEDLIRLLIILMYTLQVAQDNLEFTHYDLHMSNVLIVQLNKPEKVRIKYNNKEMFIITDVIPHIIDYGRSYVKPEYVNGDDDNTFTDVQLNKKFGTFAEYQKTLFKNTDWVITNKHEDLSFIDDQLTQSVFKNVYKQILYSDSEGNFYYKVNGQRNYDLSDDIVSINFKKMIVDQIYNKESPENSRGNYIETRSGIKVTRYNLGITSYKFNPKYDFYRFTRSVLHFLLERVPNNLHYIDMWNDLDVQLETEYPFYDPNYFTLPCDYHISEIPGISDVNPSEILNKWLKTPADIGEYLYTHIIQKDDITGIRVHHIGGGNIKRQKTEKNKDVSNKQMSDKDFTTNIEINDKYDLGFVYNKQLDNLHTQEHRLPKQVNVKYGSIPRPNKNI
jgi:putative lipoic acid-binding regulatory protein